VFIKDIGHVINIPKLSENLNRNDEIGLSRVCTVGTPGTLYTVCLITQGTGINTLGARCFFDAWIGGCWTYGYPLAILEQNTDREGGCTPQSILADFVLKYD
jgi:hypothetical protein